MITRKELLHRGKAKAVYATDDPSLVIIDFSDDATAFDGKKRGTIGNKGMINAAISVKCFEILEESRIKTHLIRKLSDRELVAHRLDIVPIEVVVRNIAAGSIAKRLGLKEGYELPRAVVELYLKDDELGDPLINDQHALVLDLATEDELDWLKHSGLKVNEVLSSYFRSLDLLLVDFKLEFGRLTVDPTVLVLGDEISPDTCRLWDAETKEKLDKDRFRQDLGGTEEAYQEVYRRMTRGK